MSVPVASTAEVIADRYLTSPVSLRSRPFGPVDALDTHAGRAAQVRIVFLPGDWGHEELSETVARWCGIGTAGVIGVLDFGDHNGHPFLVLPPSLGMPLERWRAMRRPSAVDAARLALGFGRLVEAVAARGFVTDAAEATDFGVGPGPTPFLEQPLLGRPGAPAVLRPEQDGQVLIARLYSATVFEEQLPAQIAGWVDAAANREFGSLANCLDGLEAAATAVHESRERGEPVGVKGVFDHPVIASDRVPWWDRVQTIMATRWFRWLRVVVALLVFLLAVLNLYTTLSSSHHDANTGTRPTPPVTHPAPIPSPSKPVHRSAPPHHTTTHRHPQRRPHHRRHKPHSTTPPAAVTTPTESGIAIPPPAPPATSHRNPPLRVVVVGPRSGPVVLRHPSLPS